MAILGRYLVAAFFLFAGGRPVFSTAQQVPAPPRQVSFQFTVFALGGMVGVAYLSKPDAAPQPLRFYSAYRSSVYKYKGGEQVRFCRQTTDGSPPAVVAVYTVPEGAKNLLLLFFPKAAPSVTGLLYDIYGVDDSVDKTSAGSFSTINVSGREYAAQYGSARFNIPQGVGGARAGKGRVKLFLASAMDGGWMSAGKHEFLMGAQDRVTLIFYPPANQTAVYPIIRRLTDSMPPTIEKAEEDAPDDVPDGDS